jgi:hypothetical protein
MVVPQCPHNIAQRIFYGGVISSYYVAAFCPNSAFLSFESCVYSTQKSLDRRGRRPTNRP